LRRGARLISVPAGVAGFVFWKLSGKGFVVRLFFFILVALIVGAGLGYFGPGLVFAADRTELTFPAPDPDAKFVKLPKLGNHLGVIRWPTLTPSMIDLATRRLSGRNMRHPKLLFKLATTASGFRS
jgi:hypothetical protein